MYKLVALFVLIFGLAGISRSQAQVSLKGTNWKFYVDALHDTLTMHIGNADTSFTTSSSGEIVVRSISRLSNDTLRIKDIGGEYYCPDGEGVYKIKMDGDYLNFFLVTDPCNGRNEALNGAKFKRSMAMTK